MENTCVIGYGVVGRATAEIFGINKHFDVKEELSNVTLEQASQCRIIFICLPTLVDDEGNYKVQEIVEIIKQLETYRNDPIYVIRSTVFPGFALSLQKNLEINRIISNPEFLSEATAVEDMKNSPFVLIGGIDGVFRNEVRAFYEARLKGATVIITDNTTAEMTKLTMNAFFATKVIFANQVYDACRRLGANYETVKKAIESHPFGSKNHFTIWFKEKRGVNGRCLPKDSKAFSYYSGSELVKKVVELNNRYIHLKTDDELPS